MSRTVALFFSGSSRTLFVVGICRVLGHSNPTVAVRILNADERAKSDLGRRLTNIISESGLYKLIMRSDKPEARKFQDWVTREVLPAIRKTGGYLLNEEARDTAKADDRAGTPARNHHHHPNRHHQGR